MENKCKCCGILLENILNRKYGMANIVGDYMENKSKCWKTLLYNILNGDYCWLLHGKSKDC